MTDSKPKPSKPKAPSPAALAGKVHAPVKVPVVADVSDADLKAAAKYGSVEDGKVFVKNGTDQVEIGPAEGDEPLLPYARKYFAHIAELERFHARLEVAELSPRDIENGIKKAQAAIDKPDYVGSIAAFKKRAKPVIEEATALRDKANAEREAARAKSLENREQLVAKAEALVAKPADKIHWKNDTAELRGLLDEWKAAQRDDARIGKDVEKELWKRFAAARSAFEKTRKAHFAELDKVNSDVATAKEKLVARAEALSTSTDWVNTARAFADLMSEWKASGRGRRSVDDALWKRFQTAQDAFFEAKRQTSEAEDEALAANVEPKEAAVKAAEAILPIKDLRVAKEALRAAQDRFEAAGKVPRGDVKRLTTRMAAVEKEVRDAEEAEWTSRNPEVEARVSGAAAQLESAIAELDADIAAAEAKGDKKKVKELTESRAARTAWLEQIAKLS